MRWFGRKSSHKERAIYLRNITVAKRSGYKRSWDDGRLSGSIPLLGYRGTQDQLPQLIRNIFIFPSVPKNTVLNENDLYLDITISSYEVGTFFYSLLLNPLELLFHFLGHDLFWRPKVTVKIELSSVKDNQIQQSYSVTEKMKWKHFWKRVFTFRDNFNILDLERLLNQASVKLLQKIK